ncbi:hypothetical protein Tco_0892062 [Tanacetum coccineum]|uniref:Uncharacterized protein n=1 Tax=Tanacetum coccineum TaxID=301880 RepID=A0ABQ5C4T8_9ASTR
MFDWVSTVVMDESIQTEIEMVNTTVEIEDQCMKTDQIDKETMSSDGMQSKQADVSCIHALNEHHWHEICVILNVQVIE